MLMVLWLILIKFGIKESGIATFFYIRVKIGLITSILKCKLIINKEFLSELNCHHLNLALINLLTFIKRNTIKKSP